MSIPRPKIVYPSGGTGIFSPLYQLREVPYKDYVALRSDNVAFSGNVERVYQRTDEFLHFLVENTKLGSDVAGWDQFVLYALQGGSFDYYPDGSQPSFTVYELVDTTWRSDFKHLKMFTFSMRWRKIADFGLGTHAACPNVQPVLGVPYAWQIHPIGGTAPWSFALIAGSFPPGITVSPTGLISGTATVLGHFSWTVQITDSSTPPIVGTMSCEFDLEGCTCGLADLIPASGKANLSDAFYQDAVRVYTGVEQKTSPGGVYQDAQIYIVNKSNPLAVEQIIDAGPNADTIRIISSDDTYIYALVDDPHTGAGQGTLRRYLRSNPATYNSLVLWSSSGNDYWKTSQSVIANGFMYISKADNSLADGKIKIFKINLTTFAIANTLTVDPLVATGATTNYGLAADETSGMLYVSCAKNVAADPIKSKLILYFIDLATFTEITHTAQDINAGVVLTAGVGSAPIFNSKFVYVGYQSTNPYTVPGAIRFSKTTKALVQDVRPNSIPNFIVTGLAVDESYVYSVSSVTKQLNRQQQDNLEVVEQGVVLQTNASRTPVGVLTDDGAFWIEIQGDFSSVDDMTQHVCDFDSAPCAEPARPDIAFGFLSKNMYVAITGPGAVKASYETTAGSFVFQPWVDITVPSGTWERITFDKSNVAFYLTRESDGKLAVAYELRIPPPFGPLTDQPFFLVTPTPSGTKGRVSVFDEPSDAGPPFTGGSDSTHLLCIGNTNKLAFVAGDSGSPTSPYYPWFRQVTLPISREWGCMIEENWPIHSGGGDVTVILPKNDTTFVHSNNTTHIWSTGTCLSGDWRDVKVGDQSARPMMAVGAVGGLNQFMFSADDSVLTWISMTPPVGWNPVNPRLIWINEGVTSGSVDGAWIAIDGAGMIAFSEMSSGVCTPWAPMIGVPVIAGAVWTGIDYIWAGSQLRVLIIGTVNGVPALLVSNNAFISPFTVHSFTQKDFTTAPY